MSTATSFGFGRSPLQRDTTASILFGTTNFVSQAQASQGKNVEDLLATLVLSDI
jgi:hypothetical protein